MHFSDYQIREVRSRSKVKIRKVRGKITIGINNKRNGIHEMAYICNTQTPGMDNLFTNTHQ